MLKIPEDSKLISAGQLYKYADGEYQRLKTKYGENELVSFAENVRDIICEMAYDLPAIKVLRAAWVFSGKNRCHCANCGYVCNIETQLGWSFCPNCGAQMEGDI